MTTLILIRHGESEANRQGVFAGQINPDLQDRGFKQAQRTAEYIANNYKVDKIYSSDLMRAYKTAKCLADVLDMDIIKDKNLREIYGGKWEGIKFSDLSKLYPKEYEVWMKDIGNSCCVEGESVKQLGDRVMTFLTKIAEENDGKTIAIATHATPIRAFQTMIQTGSLKEMVNIPWVSNASVSVFVYDNGRWSTSLISQDAHLEDFITNLPKDV